MIIANPIYDVVFKYLLEDEQVAKLLLSALINEEITELTVRPQERTAQLVSRKLIAYRLDFTATIKNAKGESRKVLIEIQKKKLETDIPRFRRYLGDQYRDAANESVQLPILTIYFLGYSLERYLKAPVIHVERRYIDVAMGKVLSGSSVTIENLTHDSYVIQIPSLPKHQRTDLEKMLQVFNQKKQINDDKHFLNIEEEIVPERYQSIVRRLQRAASTPEVAESMTFEDEMLWELETREQKLEIALAEKEQERIEKEQALTKAEIERTEKEQALADVEKERAEKERLLALLTQAGLQP